MKLIDLLLKPYVAYPLMIGVVGTVSYNVMVPSLSEPSPIVHTLPPKVDNTVIHAYGPQGCMNGTDLEQMFIGNDIKMFKSGQEDEPKEIEILPGIYTEGELFQEDWVLEVIKPIAEAVPIAYPVILRPISSMSFWGLTFWNDKDERYEVWINFMSPLIVGEIIAHEWAHMAVYDVPGKPHGPAWGVLFSECYQVLIEE